MAFLVDTNVLSELTKQDPNPNVVRWLQENEEELLIDPIVLGEIQAGIWYLPKGKRRQRLEQWFAEVKNSMFCLTWDSETAMSWARLLVALKISGKSMPLKDSFIAASAPVHHLTIATRNERDFRSANVPIFNPFI